MYIATMTIYIQLRPRREINNTKERSILRSTQVLVEESIDE